jgi:hypothetical protein
VSSADLADLAIPAPAVTPADNPWTLTVSHVARVLRRSPATVRAWCARGWFFGELCLARKVGGEWMIHAARFAAYLSQEPPAGSGGA